MYVTTLYPYRYVRTYMYRYCPMTGHVTDRTSSCMYVVVVHRYYAIVVEFWSNKLLVCVVVEYRDSSVCTYGTCVCTVLEYYYRFS